MDEEKKDEKVIQFPGKPKSDTAPTTPPTEETPAAPPAPEIPVVDVEVGAELVNLVGRDIQLFVQADTPFWKTIHPSRDHAVKIAAHRLGGQGQSVAGGTVAVANLFLSIELPPFVTGRLLLVDMQTAQAIRATKIERPDVVFILPASAKPPKNEKEPIRVQALGRLWG